MGFFDWDAGSVLSRRSSHHSKHGSGGKHAKHHHRHKSSRSSKSPSRSRSRSRGRHASGSVAGAASSIFGGDAGHHKHNSSRASFFSLPNASRSSFFGFGRPSYYKRSPRPSFLARSWKKLQRLLRDLAYYARRHPLKVFALVVMPLLTGGFLTALLARFGLRVPAGLERALGLGARAVSGDGLGLVGEAVRMAQGAGPGAAATVERGRAGGLQWERRRVDAPLGGGGGGGGWGGGLMSAVGKFF